MKKIFMGFIILILCLCFINVAKADYWEYQSQSDNYSCYGDWNSGCSFCDDDDIDTICSGEYVNNTFTDYYFNITKKVNSGNFQIEFKSNVDFSNISVPLSCSETILEGDYVQFWIHFENSEFSIDGNNTMYCYNSTDWEELVFNQYNFVYELASYQYIIELIEPIEPVIWFISAPENETIINQKYFDTEIDYNISLVQEGYPVFDGVRLQVYNLDDIRLYNVDISETNTSRIYLENGDYYFRARLIYCSEECNDENDIIYYTDVIYITMNGNYTLPEIWFESGTKPNGTTLNQDFIYIEWDYNLNDNEYSRVAPACYKDVIEGYPAYDYNEYNPNVKNYTFENVDSGIYFCVLELAYNNETSYIFDTNEFRQYNLISEEEPEEIDFNIESKIFMIITILIIFSIAIFLFDKFGKKGMSKLSIFLIMLFVLSLKVFAVTNNYVMESNLLTIVTILLILGLIYFLYQKIFNNK